MTENNKVDTLLILVDLSHFKILKNEKADLEAKN